MKKIIAIFVLLASLLGLETFSLYGQTVVSLEEAAQSSVHAVVHVKTEFARKNNIYDFFFDIREFFNYPNQEREASVIMATGSGVLISADGYIVTNNHVVQDAIKVEITLNDKRSYEADIVGTDPSTDLALLKIKGENLPFLRFGNSDEVKVGEWVLAVGNPLNLTSTVTAGIISAKARDINILQNTEYGSAIESFLQTDAAVNSGNSGGALVNVKGELIGINTAIASGTGYFAGYSFAIPVNLVKKVTGDLKKYGVVKRALLGVGINDINSEFAEMKKLEVLRGAYVNKVQRNDDNSQYGIKEGDVIVAINGKDINSSSELLENIGQRDPEEIVMVTVNRAGKVMDFDVTLLGVADYRATTQLAQTEKIDFLGVELRNATIEELKEFNVKNGVLVTRVYDGKLKQSGIKQGLLITKVDNLIITSADQLENYLSNKRGGVLLEGKYSEGYSVYYGFGL